MVTGSSQWEDWQHNYFMTQRGKCLINLISPMKKYTLLEGKIKMKDWKFSHSIYKMRHRKFAYLVFVGEIKNPQNQHLGNYFQLIYKCSHFWVTYNSKALSTQPTLNSLVCQVGWIAENTILFNPHASQIYIQIFAEPNLISYRET